MRWGSDTRKWNVEEHDSWHAMRGSESGASNQPTAAVISPHHCIILATVPVPLAASAAVQPAVRPTTTNLSTSPIHPVAYPIRRQVCLSTHQPCPSTPGSAAQCEAHPPSQHPSRQLFRATSCYAELGSSLPQCCCGCAAPLPAPGTAHSVPPDLAALLRYATMLWCDVYWNGPFHCRHCSTHCVYSPEP